MRQSWIRTAVIVSVLAMASAQRPQAQAPAVAPAGDAAVEAKVEALLAQLSVEEKLALLGGVEGFYAPGNTKIGLPKMKMSDGPSGARNDGFATTMGGIALAATWNEAVAREVGLQIGRDARARGVHFMLGPGVNIYTSPLNGRNFEYFGEDPLLAGRIAAGYVEGLQSQKVAATIKHFAANNSEYARHEVDVIVDERTLREIYLPAFEAAVKAGVGSVMTSYQLVNGQHMSQQGALVNDILKKDWGFKGLVMSDWMSTYDGVAAANGGLDLEMPAGWNLNAKVLLPALKDGKVSQATIDDKVRRLLRTAVRFGWIGNDQFDRSIPMYNQQGRKSSLRGAREGIVLLKNQGNVLPLDRAKAKRIAVIGPLAYPGAPVGGGSGESRPYHAIGLLEGLSDLLGTAADVTYHPGLPTLSKIAGSTKFTTAVKDGKPGMTVEVFDNPKLEGKPVSTRSELRVNVKPLITFADLADMDMGELFGDKPLDRGKPTSARWTGYYQADKAGTFEVFLLGGGEGAGVRLRIDDRLVVDAWEVHKSMLSSSTISLDAGAHKVVFEEFSPGGLLDAFVPKRLGIIRQDALVDPAAKAMAAAADAVVIAAGWDASVESEGNDRQFNLPAGQDQLIREIAAVHQNPIVVLTSGGAVDTRPWLDKVGALIAGWFPGQEGGTALAEVLMGDVNPSGHLPISWDKAWEENPSFDSYYPEKGTRRLPYLNGVYVGYRGYERNKVQPLFPFGFGLSYTTFAFENLQISPVAGAPVGTFDVTFDAKNTGSRAGAAVPQVYVGDTHAKVPRPPKELRGFSKVELKPGESKMVTVRLDPRAFTYYDVAGKQWKADAGDFAVLVGSSSAQIDLKGTVVLKADLTLKPASAR